MAVARSVFAEQGYHTTSMEIIAETAGVSKPLLYQHFPSKLDLYLALLDAGIDELLDKSDASLRDITDNKLRVIATVQTYFEFVDDPQDAYRLVFESDLTNEPEVRARLERLEGELSLAFKDSVVYAAKSVNSLPCPPPDFGARVGELMQTTSQSVASLADLDDRFKAHLSTAFAAIEKEFGVVKAAIQRRDATPF